MTSNSPWGQSFGQPVLVRTSIWVPLARTRPAVAIFHLIEDPCDPGSQVEKVDNDIAIRGNTPEKHSSSSRTRLRRPAVVAVAAVGTVPVPARGSSRCSHRRTSRHCCNKKLRWMAGPLALHCISPWALSTLPTFCPGITLCCTFDPRDWRQSVL